SGQTVTTTLEFFVPVDVSDGDNIAFALPAFVSAYDPAFSHAVEETMKGGSGTWSAKFALQSTPVAPASATSTRAERLRIYGQLAVPWAAPNNASAASAKIKPKCNVKLVAFEQLAQYGFVSFEFDSSKNDATQATVLPADEGFSLTLVRPAAV